MSKCRAFFLVGTLCLISLFAASVQAQNAIQIFAPVNVNNSIKSGPYTYGTNTLSVTCPAAGITAVVSSTTNGQANVFEDNLLYLKNVDNPNLTPADGGDHGINGGLNICRGGDTNPPGNGNATNCFQLPYESAVGQFVGQNPDAVVAPTYGVPAIDVHSYLQSGTQKLKVDLIDYGGFLGSSSLYLVTNCTQNGVVTGGTITGNPIPPTNPPPSVLTQTFPFDNTSGQLVKFTADFSPANSSGTLTITGTPVPIVTDTLISASDYKNLVKNTSLAPSDCIPLSGELDASGNPACKIFTIQCVVGSNQSGTLCPQSSARNSLFTAKFDSDAAFIGALPPGTGFGLLMGPDIWTTPNCQFIPGSPDANLLCPQNIETNFLGDYATGGGTKSLNSSFVAARGVPLPATSVTVSPQPTQYGWTNSANSTVTFVSNPATYAGPNPLNGFIPAPIASLTYGVVDPVPDTTLPVSGDTTNTNTVPCPTTPTNTPPIAYTSTASIGPLSDGQHTLHYFATDCAGTEELVYTVQPANLGNWASFKTVTLNVDTQVPTAAFNPQPSANNVLLLNGPAATVNFKCSDAGSGLAVCGTNASQALGTTGVPNYAGSINIPANVPGTSTNIAIYAKDLAGNTANTSNVNYTVQYSTGTCLGSPGHQILPPVAADGSSVFKKGRSVPAKFRVCDANGVSIGAPGTVKSVSVQAFAGVRQVDGDDTGDDADDATFRWSPTDQLWIYNIRTKELERNLRYVFTVTLNDNSTIVFQFSLR